LTMPTTPRGGAEHWSPPCRSNAISKSASTVRKFIAGPRETQYLVKKN